jgi:hypothetical protein
VREQKLALVVEVFLQDELVDDSLEPQGHLGAVDVRAAQGADELHRFRHLWRCLDVELNVYVLHAGALGENILVAPQERARDYAMFSSAESY